VQRGIQPVSFSSLRWIKVAAQQTRRVLRHRGPVGWSGHGTRTIMDRNLGGLDRLVRFYLGLVMIASALPYWAPQTGWNWIGWFGVLPLASALVGSCKLYSLVGLSTRPAVTRPA
jgi:hypothetical protein